jgi:hypothetical protein
MLLPKNPLEKAVFCSRARGDERYWMNTIFDNKIPSRYPLSGVKTGGVFYWIVEVGRQKTFCYMISCNRVQQYCGF